MSLGLLGSKYTIPSIEAISSFFTSLLIFDFF
jgi:hypothetical protein